MRQFATDCNKLITAARPMHQLTAAPGLMGLRDGVSPMAQSTAAAAIDDGQWSRNSMSVAGHMLEPRHGTVFIVCDTDTTAATVSLPCIADRITCVARATRDRACRPPGSTLHAKKSMKVNGVTERSRQFSAVRTRSSIRTIVCGSKM